MKKRLKSIAILVAVSILLAPLVGCGGAGEPKEGIFPDPNLEAAIREAIGKPEGEICQPDLKGLTELDASWRAITDVCGLEYCTNLALLALGDNQINDISPLSSLTSLTILALESNQISDINSLSNLIKLGDAQFAVPEIIHLNLSKNQITNVQPLLANPGLSARDHVDLRDNPLSIESVTVYIPQLQARGVVMVSW